MTDATNAGALLRVGCACGWEVVGTEEIVVPAVIDHGLRVHNMEGSREQVLANAERVVDRVAEPQLQVVDNPDANRYEAIVGDRVVGFSEYRPATGRRIFTHTEVDPEFEGRGVGSRLAKGALDDVRARGLMASVHCPFISAYIERHHEFDDIVIRRGSGT
jgi:uncharacterized protein